MKHHGQREVLEAIMDLVRANYNNGELAERFQQGRATRADLRAARQAYNCAYRRVVALLALWPYRESPNDMQRHSSRTFFLTEPAGRRN